MRRKWNLTHFIAVGSLAALDVIVGLGASVITAATGITMASGVITSLTEPLLLMVCLFAIDRLGAATLFMTIVAFLTLPLAYAGPPGFLPKIPIIILLGLICDSLYLILKKLGRVVPSITIGGFLCLWYVFAVAYAARLLEVPGVDNFLNIMPIPILVTLVFLVGSTGGMLGLLVYRRLENSAVMVRLRAEGANQE